MMDSEELRVRFSYHAPDGSAVVDTYQVVRDAALSYAQLLADLVPPSRELSLAVTNLEQTVMWANAGIARRPHQQPSEGE